MPLEGARLLELQENMRGVDYLIIDEFSMLGQVTLFWVDRRLREATGHKDLMFGGLSVILTGDPGQLPPVLEKPMWAPLQPDCHANNRAGRNIYRRIRLAFILSFKFRQAKCTKGDQPSFPDILDEPDWKV